MTQRVERRTFLQSITIGIAGLTGCAMFESQTESRTPRLVELTALNLDDSPHTFHVRLELDGETVYRESEQVAAGGSEDPRAAEFSGYPTQAEPYVLSAWRDDQPEAGAKTLDLASYDAECLGVDVRFGTYGSDAENPRLAIFHTTNCDAGT
jgi:hypothetical protein